MESPWILVLCHEFPPLGGGAGKNLYLLCRELTRRGLKVRVWTTDPGKGSRWKHEFPVEYIATSRTERFETNLGGMAGFAKGACALGLRNRRDKPVLVLATLGVAAGLPGRFLSHLYKVPLAVWHHGSDVHAGTSEGPGRLQKFLLRRVWAKSALNFFVSPSLLELASKIGRPPRPRILPACPSPEIMGAMATSVADPLASARGFFLFLGRFDPVKNPLLLVEAASVLKAQKAEARLVRMVGSGSMAGSIFDFIRHHTLADRIALQDAVPFDKVPGLLGSTYAIVVPSRIEGFNTTILEAAHFGVPAVAADVPGIRDFVKDGETGLLFPDNDAAGLAAALKRLSADPGLRDALGARARAAAAPYFPARVADSFLTEVEALVPGMAVYAQGTPAWN